MIIRQAEKNDIPRLTSLLHQVLDVHQKARPDIFRAGAAKYTQNELCEILEDETRPVFVAVDDRGEVVGYCFCIFICHENDNILTDIKTLYIDDLCVDENARGGGVGKQLYQFAVAFAKAQGCYNLTLNVWADNKNALGFYRSLGLGEQKIGMELILE